MRCVPGGGFLRGSRRFQRERPAERVWLQTFYLDTHEVTVEAYEACVARGHCQPARTLYEDFSRPRQPKVGVTWAHADAFCRAQGKQLPTEAQWEKAARTDDGRRYPWGNERATCERAVIETRAGRGCGVKKQGETPDTGRTQEVGSRPPNPYGLYDLSGNAWEWVADWFSESYAKCGAACRGVDPKGPCGGADPCPGHFQRVLRGGSWFWDESYATTTFRHHHYPANEPYHHFGFRCAATLDQARELRRPR
ncbi:MAG: SUMF1/EgtB/PvdO family nonheme iron enzyme [Polyangiaceae bacterium]|nr:SUMF1/EgtB/PvdO family nonheme iron enzyme [Polyangiaceae bacterium]